MFVLNSVQSHLFIFFFFTDPPTPATYTLSLHDALPIFRRIPARGQDAERLVAHVAQHRLVERRHAKSEEHTSELQSRRDLVCRLLLEKKKKPNEFLSFC